MRRQFVAVGAASVISAGMAMNAMASGHTGLRHGLGYGRTEFAVRRRLVMPGDLAGIRVEFAGGLPFPHLRAFPVETGRLLASFFFSGAL